MGSPGDPAPPPTRLRRQAASNGLHVDMAADLTQLAPARRMVRAWLDDRGVERVVAEDIVLVCSEACANAIEHGAQSDPAAWVELSITATNGSLVIRVAGPGPWRPAGEHMDGRGRGLGIMRALSDD